MQFYHHFRLFFNQIDHFQIENLALLIKSDPLPDRKWPVEFKMTLNDLQLEL